MTRAIEKARVRIESAKAVGDSSATTALIILTDVVIEQDEVIDELISRIEKLEKKAGVE